MTEPEPTGESRVVRALRAIAVTLEPMLVLILTLFVATAAGAPLLPGPSGVAFPLRSVSGAERPSDAELIRMVDAEGLAESVDIRLMRGAEQLVLERPVDRARAEARVRELLPTFGYHATEPADALPVDLGRLFEGSPTRLAALLSIQALALLLAALLMTRWRVRPALRLPVGPGRAVLEGCAAGLGALFASAAIGGLLEAVGLPVEEQPWIKRLFEDREAWLPIAPWLVLIGPVAEELFFRGYMYRFVRQELGVASSIVLTSVLFAAIHTNLSGVPVYMAIGALLAYVYQRTGTLLAPIVAHVLLNAVVLAVSTGTIGGG